MQIKYGTAVLLAASASALQITSPSIGDKLDLTKSNEVTWDSVDSDPTSFNIELVNESVNPPTVKTLASNVQTSAHSYSFSNVATDVGSDYQINLVGNDPSHNTGILAQSPKFDVTNAVDTSSTSTASSTATSSSSTSTGTSSSSTSTTTTTTTSSSANASSSGVHSSSASAIAVSALGTVLGSVFALFM